MLDVRDGVVLALILFGASVFGSRRSLPEGFQIDHSVRRWGQRVQGSLALNSEDFRGARNGPETAQVTRWGVQSMIRGRVMRGQRNRAGSTG